MDLGIIRTLERKGAVVQAAPDRHTGLRRVAQTLDRRNADAAHVELVTEALHRLAELVYQEDGAGWVNCDPVTGRLLIPAPWGKAGRAMWGLYPSEGMTLNAILRSRQGRRGHTAWLWYDRDRRCWAVDLAAYPTMAAALEYLAAHPIAVEEWRHFYAKTRPPR